MVEADERRRGRAAAERLASQVGRRRGVEPGQGRRRHSERWRIRQADARAIRSRRVGHVYLRSAVGVRADTCGKRRAGSSRTRNTDAHRRRAARSAAVRRVLSLERHGPGRSVAPVLYRARQLYRARRREARCREPQGGGASRRRERSVHDFHRRRQRRDVLPRAGRLLQTPGSIPRCYCESHGARVSSDCRRRIRSAARRPRASGHLGHARSATERRGVQALCNGACRSAEPGVAGHPGGSRPLPHLLGKLARTPHDRYPVTRHRGRHAQGQGSGLFRRSGQRASRA